MSSSLYEAVYSSKRLRTALWNFMQFACGSQYLNKESLTRTRSYIPYLENPIESCTSSCKPINPTTTSETLNIIDSD